jgi:hypothetical protein
MPNGRNKYKKEGEFMQNLVNNQQNDINGDSRRKMQLDNKDSQAIPMSSVSTFGFLEFIPNDQFELIAEILNPLQGYGVQGALDILDNCKKVIMTCTPIPKKYEV